MLREDLQKTLKESMLAHDTATTGAVRLIIAGMKDKDVEARGKGAKEANENELLAMMQTMIKQRKDSIKIYIDGNRQDLADKELSEIKVIERFLPKQMNEQEIQAIVKSIIDATNATTMKDMGKVMAVLKSQYVGQMDMGKANSVIKNLLS